MLYRAGKEVMSNPRFLTLSWPLTIRVYLGASHSMPYMRSRYRDIRVIRLSDYIKSNEQEVEKVIKEELGWKNNVTTIIGTSTRDASSLRLKRLPANGADDKTLLNAMLGGAYDWLGALQQAAKSFRRRDSQSGARSSGTGRRQRPEIRGQRSEVSEGGPSSVLRLPSSVVLRPTPQLRAPSSQLVGRSSP